MVSNAISDYQSDSSAGTKSNDLTGQALAQSVFRTNPADFLSAIQSMTSNSGSSDFLQPLRLLGDNDSSSASSSGQSGSSDSAHSFVSPGDSGSFAYTTDGNNLTSIALPTDNQTLASRSDHQSTPLSTAFPTEGNSGQTSNLPESNSGQNVGSSEYTWRQSTLPIETNPGQTAVSPESSSSGLETNNGQTAVSPESSSGQTDSSAALKPNSSFDQMPQINQSNNNSEISQLENQILTDMQELIQLLENKWQPQPSPEPTPEPSPEPTPEPSPEPTPEPTPEPEPTPTPQPEPGPLKGDVASIQKPDSTTNQITYQTTDGQTKTAPLPSTYDGTGSYVLYSDGVLAYLPNADGGQEYLDDSKNPPQWIDFDGPNTPGPTGDVVASYAVGGGQVQDIDAPAADATTMQIHDTDRAWQTIPTPPDYNGTGTFSLFQNGVLAYSGPPGESGGEYYYDQALNPPGWVNNDGPDPGPNAPSGEVVQSWTPANQMVPLDQESED